MKDLEKFEESPVSQGLIEFFRKKFPQTVVLIALLKCLVMISCKLRTPRFSLSHIAPSRHFKTYTSNEVMKIFNDDFWINLRSDFTIHSLERYKTKLKQNVCLNINDATLLFASKAQRTKDRLVGALSELLSDASYTYQDFNRKFDLKGWISLIMNMTSESYQNYKDRLFGLTFQERVLTVHSILKEEEILFWTARQEETAKIHYNGKITLADIELKINRIPSEYLETIQHQAREFSYLSLKGYIGCQDTIKGILRAHAALNKRHDICNDDLMLLSMIKPHLTNPFSPNEGKIVKYAAQGLSYRNICALIGKDKNYVRYVYSVVEKARLRGIIPIHVKQDREK